MKKNTLSQLTLLTIFSCTFCIATAIALTSTVKKSVIKTNQLPERYFTYIAQKGDTLWKITDKYLKNPAQWKLIQVINNVADPKKIMPLQAIKIPDYSIRTELLSIAILQQKGDVFFNENNHIIQTSKGNAVIKLNDGSLITVFPESIVKILKYEKVGQDTITDIFVEKGKVQTQVSKQTQHSRFNVRTPLAVAGVRGTTFQTRVESDTVAFTEMDEGKVQITSTNLLSKSNNISDEIIGGYAAKSTPKGNIIEKRPNAVDTSKLPKIQTDLDVCFIIPVLAASENVINYKIELSTRKDNFMNSLSKITIKQDDLRKYGLNLGNLESDNYLLKIIGITAQGIEGNSVIHLFNRIKPAPKKPVMIDLSPISSKINYEFEKKRLAKIHLGVPLIEQKNNQLMVYWQKLPKQNYEVVLQKVKYVRRENASFFASTPPHALQYEKESEPLVFSVVDDNKLLLPTTLKSGDYTLEIKGFAPLDALKIVSVNPTKLEKSETMLLHIPDSFFNFNSQVEVVSTIIYDNL